MKAQWTAEVPLALRPELLVHLGLSQVKSPSPGIKVGTIGLAKEDRGGKGRDPTLPAANLPAGYPRALAARSCWGTSHLPTDCGLRLLS